MNILSEEKQQIVISALVEGSSIRSIERMTGIHRDTIMRLMVRIGEKCESLLDKEMRGLSCQNFQMDEIWCYVGKKQKHLKETDNNDQLGDQWVFVALDAESKLIPSYKIGKRDLIIAEAFLK